MHGIHGIHEVCQEEEQSPDFKKAGLPSIEEETKNYVFPKISKEKEFRICKFLDKMNICQVYPSEINSLKLAY
jgi:hypothetical protein